ncbi:helicase-exonuclease AddAB subunit AddA [Clostridium tyrobutyricum]|uniref:ATP-dependent helicase/nuclease subunit A n=1 Tax=Clostridium tyrobutyricum DIVETGP TaxID=1408889 RepID=W6N5U0_CLOTY|nr:helicase-exonuclease AddAB subunit AddA [Clostridium tyrobutyricum]AND84092.1 ATP-dependent helicase/nuclease subunit A [Clostridium tyrobutyricum]ANP68822.1 helicase-exonuclease AddAB subunit AddA [Clostridium tyrobutyricum]MBV4427108.1 helicase-exonuclease AddAB subunit AddA [Clostridium tyrobutyricum]MBV4433499.1 helicase-exonuclease AddAB subunit AddA [Clostridium tyrobutyricum]MBV4433600.1 helicase-exonuclease AddAB subunit AddA [Clostridium tyrobutyricum]
MVANWTDEQRKAIFTERSNVLVAAGAGAGKTAVLVERIIRKITDPDLDIDIDKLLVVTYTNAAAAEMKERIGDELQKLLEDNFESRRLQRQLTLLNQSNIMTMHSFCLKIIKNNFQLVDLDPNFRVSDNEESILLKRDAVFELFEEKYDSNDSSFLNLIDSYGDKNDTKVQDIVISLYEFVQSVPWPEKWLNKASEQFNLSDDFEFETSLWAQIIISDLKVEIKSLRDRLKRALELIFENPGFEGYEPIFKNEVGEFEYLLKLKSWNEIDNYVQELKFQRLPRLKSGSYDEDIKIRVTKTRDNVKKRLKHIMENILNYGDDVDKSIRDMYPVMKCLTDLVMDFANKYADKKRERNILDFSDIEHFCLNILTRKDKSGDIIPSDTALYYRKYFAEILVDEYQDSNGVQEVIINMINRDDETSNLFMVGDVKQSIYRFRQAKPELFLEKYRNYSEEENSKNRKIKLFKNFRSRHEIIDGVNYLFSQIMRKKIGELDYVEGEQLESAATYPDTTDSTFSGEAIEVNLIDKVRSEDEQEDLSNIQVEGRLIAKKIKDIVNPEDNQYFKVYDKDIRSYRNLMYKDIVILMRATKNWAQTIMEELNNANIPVFADTSTGYFETIEIKTIMSLLQIIDNPIQDIPLISVLRSPIASFSPEELIDIRIVNKDVSFYEALNICCNEEDVTEDLKEKISSFLDRMDKWRKKIVYMPIDEFLWYLYSDTGYYGFVGAMTGGTQRQANLRMLFEKAEQYEKSSYKGLFNFINFVNKLRNSSGDMGSAKILGENENVVRIMSIHKSKGLEFPVVILAGAGKNFNFMDANNPIIFNEELGLGPEYVDIERRIHYPTIIKHILRSKLKNETLSEEMRILYVAFTRAKEKLIITGMINNVEDTFEKWCDDSLVEENKVPEYALQNAKNYLEWIGMAIVRHKDGKIIRKIANHKNCKFLPIEHISNWKINIYSREDFSENSQVDTEIDIIEHIKNRFLDKYEDEYFQEINRRLNWKYKYEEASKIPAKFSVSELKRRFALIDMEDSSHLVEDVNLKKPNFIKENTELSGAQRGTLMHLAMQHIDINNTDSKSNIDTQIENLVLGQFITDDEKKAISSYKILKFFNSNLGIRMKSSKKVYREVPFYIQESSSDIYKDLPKDLYKDEKILIQGIIDCYFEEDDGLVLIDYKTDYVERTEELKDKYKIQIYYYSKALENMTGINVKERYIYSFHKGDIIEV